MKPIGYYHESGRHYYRRRLPTGGTLKRRLPCSTKPRAIELVRAIHTGWESLSKHDGLPHEFRQLVERVIREAALVDASGGPLANLAESLRSVVESLTEMARPATAEEVNLAQQLFAWISSASSRGSFSSPFVSLLVLFVPSGGLREDRPRRWRPQRCGACPRSQRGRGTVSHRT